MNNEVIEFPVMMVIRQLVHEITIGPLALDIHDLINLPKNGR